MSKSSELKRNILLLSGLSFAAMHIINRVQETSANSKKINTSREDKIYEWRYGNISYKKKGHGPSLLLVHDLSVGSSKEEFSYIINELSNNHTVYSIDMLGYGESDKSAITYTASLYEQLLSDFIKNIIGTKTDIIVTGDCAPIILRLTHNNSEFINRIILINPLGLYDQNLIPSNQTKLMKIVISIPILGTYAYNLYSTKHILQDAFEQKYIADIDSFDKEKLNNLIDLYFRSSHIGGHKAKYSYASYISKFMTCSVLHELKEINNSILIIGGEKENEIDTNIENYLYYNNAIEYQIVKNTAHLPHIEKPEEIIEDIEVFLS